MTTLRYTFAEKEARCETLFRELSPCWHLYTAENFEIIFVTDDDFRVGMLLIALCAMSFPGIKILAFQLMNNHLHITLSGKKDDCCAFFHMFRHRLQMYLKGIGRTVDLSRWEEKLNAIEDLDYLRTVIAYTNRNGFLVDPDETPFTYRWGTNRFFFNQDAVSSVGAIGVMQLMPDTAASLGVDPYNKQQNIEGGAKYLRQMLDTFGGDTKKAVAAYNAGPGAVKDYGGVPPYKETQNYVNKVLDIYR